MSGPVTVITGTSRGIGRWLAERYAARGHQVVGCARNAADWSATGYEHVVCDVTDEAQVKSLFSHARRRYGHVDHLINNAGVAAMNHALLTPVSAVRRVFDVNVQGTFLAAREAAKLMQKQKTGRIVNFSTVAVALRLEGEAIYAASKAAVESLTRVLAREFAPFGVTVNAVGPTPVDTELVRGVPKDKLEALIARQAIQRWGTFDDVGNAVDFFLQPGSSFITGQVVYLGGVG